MSGYGLDAVNGVPGGFERSREVFESVVDELAGPGYAQVTHAELEERLTVRGRELLRQLFQDHADLREVREERLARVTGSDEVERRRVERGHTRMLGTVFGEVVCGRLAYRAIGAGNLYPADAVWNLPVDKHSHGLRRLAAIEATRGSFDAAQEAIERATGVRVGKRQIEQLAVTAAIDIAGFYTGRRPDSADPGMLLVLTFDGKGVVMRPDALRAATAKAAATATHKLVTRLSPGEKSNRKRMAELGCVYDARPVARTPADVIARPGTARDPERVRGPKARGKWLTGSVTDDIGEVIAAGFDEAQRRDPQHERTWVVLVDGNRTQIDAIGAEAGRRGVKVHILIDFIHVAEYIWAAAWSFFHKGDPDAEVWVADQLTKILAGKAGAVAAGIRRRATRFGYTTVERHGADEAAKYLTSKKPYLAYDQALARGWPIATGVIEGACRHLVKDRLDITGARWGLDGAEAILTLRAMVSNGDLNDYWAYHLQREHDRVHASRYQQQPTDYTLAA